jgi:putative transposase
MGKLQFTRAQILAILGDVAAGLPVPQVCSTQFLGTAAYYQRKMKDAGMSVCERKRTKEIEAENARLKHMYAELVLVNVAIKDVLSQKL